AASKAEAAALFARYRKAQAALPRLAERTAVLERERAATEMLLWEAERADAPALAEIAADLHPKQPAAGRARRRAVTPVILPSGARIYVGRSPRDNVEITFSIARPDDLWFHARNVPGAHVVLVPASGSQARPQDIARAAELAAAHSRARASGKIEVDYTARKFVRKQRNAPPGMVWYTDFQTILATPRENDKDETSSAKTPNPSRRSSR
ncbi:MAG: DUF814 domain-containing protein, partial [Candidatus Eremiobacteraeota bacterium]|nr:DUF814 domain-containing protein [Candidatus Eremiobacteraeota bacterium]